MREFKWYPFLLCMRVLRKGSWAVIVPDFFFTSNTVCCPARSKPQPQKIKNSKHATPPHSLECRSTHKHHISSSITAGALSKHNNWTSSTTKARALSKHDNSTSTTARAKQQEHNSTRAIEARQKHERYRSTTTARAQQHERHFRSFGSAHSVPLIRFRSFGSAHSSPTVGKLCTGALSMV